METAPRRQLTLFDSTCLIVGIIIGAGIYQVAPDVAKTVTSTPALLGLWVLGGALSLAGALSYAELSTAYPQAGGDYVYLTRAYGSWAGFLFGWIQTIIVRPGDIVVMAFAFATYARAVYDPFAGASGTLVQQLYAGGAVVVLTLLNILGVKHGKWTQNVLTVAKVLGLAAIVLMGFFSSNRGALPASTATLPMSLGLIMVLFTFGGWNEMVYVAAEVTNPAKNIVRALLLGTGAVTALYLLINGAFLHVLGYGGLSASKAVASEAVAEVLGTAGPGIIASLVCISALGAVNGLIFTGARISYAIGRDHRLFGWVGSWDEKRGTPLRALLVQGAIALVLVVLLGGFVETLLYTAAPVYLFYSATSVSLLVLRLKEPQTPRAYRVWGYPVTPVLFTLVCLYLAWSAVVYKPGIALAALGLLLVGLPAFGASRRLQTSKLESSATPPSALHTK